VVRVLHLLVVPHGDLLPNALHPVFVDHPVDSAAFEARQAFRVMISTDQSFRMGSADAEGVLFDRGIIDGVGAGTGSLPGCGVGGDVVPLPKSRNRSKLRANHRSWMTATTLLRTSQVASRGS
jgi:hypothetical protein